MRTINTFTDKIISDLDVTNIKPNQWVFPTVGVRIFNKDGKGIIASAVPRMDELEFAEWWKDFQSAHKNDKDGGLEKVKHLKSIVGEFNAYKRIAFIDELIVNSHFEYACGLIIVFGNDSQKQIIRDKLKKWIDSEFQELISPLYITTILSTYTKKDQELICKYFIDKRISQSRIPIELYQIDKGLFLKSFEKYLSNYDDENIFDDSLLYLTSHLDVLNFLINNLSKHQSGRMKKFCIIKSKKPFLDSNTKDGLIALSKK